MLTAREQEIIIEVMKPYKPIKIGVSNYFLGHASDETEILYDFKMIPGYIEFMGLMETLEEKLNRKIDLTSFEFIDSTIKNEVLKNADIFYHGSGKKTGSSQKIGAYS